MDAFWSFTRRMVREHRTGIILAMVFAFLSAGGLGAGIISLGPLLSTILDPDGGESLRTQAVQHNQSGDWPSIPQGVVESLPTDPYDGVVLIIVGLAILTVFGAIANFLHQYLAQRISTEQVAAIRQEAFEKVINLPLGRVVERGPSEFVARIIRDSAELHRGLVSLVSKSVTQVTKGLAAFIVAIFIDWRLTIVAIVVAPILGVIIRKIGKRIRRGSKGSLEAQEHLLRIATENLQGLRAVKANTAEDEALRRFSKANDLVIRHEMKMRTARALSSPLVETLAVFASSAFVLVAAKSIISGTTEISAFINALIALGVAGGSFRPLAGLIAEIQAAQSPAARLADMLDEPVEAPPRHSRPALPRHQDSIVFENVGFRYATADEPALRDFSLTVKHGERVALVGPNGSGKTTLISMLPRLLEPSRGRILIDGTDIRSVDLRSLRRQIGVVTQETVMFRGSLADNVAFGTEDVTREQIIEAARQAHAIDFIERIPGGFDADLAEQGSTLSGGQRQRIAIARAILRDPAILILDEATSQIDAESESNINAALKTFCEGRTALIVAHRLATVLSADRIVVLDEGRMIDQGAHDELLQRCPLYQRLAQTQLIASPQ